MALINIGIINNPAWRYNNAITFLWWKATQSDKYHVWRPSLMLLPKLWRCLQSCDVRFVLPLWCSGSSVPHHWNFWKSDGTFPSACLLSSHVWTLRPRRATAVRRNQWSPGTGSHPLEGNSHSALFHVCLQVLWVCTLQALLLYLLSYGAHPH